MDREAKQRELNSLRGQVLRLEAELGVADIGPSEWPPRTFYSLYYVLGGFVLGILGATTSLLFNVVGSLIIGQHPLQLIRVYLTFPLGAPALTTEDGLVLAIGCCLYLFTGMVLGIPFHWMLSRWFEGKSLGLRFVVVSLMALALWLFNFYALLSWLQPALFGGRWIIESIPWYVGAATHLVFGWTMLLVQPLGVFIAYRPVSEER
jgi:hypothetical protein